MVSTPSQEPRKIGELVFIVGIATMILALVIVVTRGFSGSDSTGMSSVGGDPNPSPTEKASERPTQNPDATRDPRDTWVPPEQFPGVEAIHPSLDTASPDEARITVSDVEAFIADFPGVDEIVSIEFLPSDVVEARLDSGPGAYGGRFLCVVDVRGSFNVGLPPEVQEKIIEEGRAFEITRAVMVFDAQTGNHLSTAYPPP